MNDEKGRFNFGLIKIPSLRKTYITSFVILAVLLLGTFFFTSREHHEEQARDIAINLAGRQRMLSQRMALLAGRMAVERGESYVELRRKLELSLKEFKSVHDGLKLGNIQLDLLPVLTEESFKLLESLNQDRKDLIASVVKVLASNEAINSEELQKLNLAAEKFLPVMDRLVFQMTKDASDLSKKYKFSHDIFLVTYLIVLGLVGFFLFEPLVRRIKSVENLQRKIVLQLKESEERFELAVVGSNDGIWDWNIETGEVYYSDRMIELLGYPIGEFSHRFESWEKTLHPEDHEATLSAVSRHLYNREVYDVEYRCRSSKGEYRWFRARGQAYWSEEGSPTRMAGSLTDISEAKQRQLELESTTQRLELALLATNTGLWDWDLLSNKTFFNDSWYTMLGYEPGELPMSLDTWMDLCHPEDLELAKVEIEKYMQGQTDMYRSPQRLRRKDGSWMWINDIGKVVAHDSSGRPARMIGVHIDIELLKKRERQLESAKENALEASQTKSKFLANMSHEIRTPLNGILGMTELLLESELDSEQQDLAVTAYRSGEALLTVVNDILDFSKIEAGKIELSPVNFSLINFLRDLEALHKVRFEQKELSFVGNIEDSVPTWLFGDPDRLRQILINLVGNALKFTPAGGSIILNISKDSSAGKKVVLRFNVIDSGIGIPIDKQDKIFEAFEQADNSITRQFGGTGLGLSISARLVELMGGKIGLESIEGSGTVFYFTAEFEIPQEVGLHSVDSGDSDLVLKLPKDLRVLLAEDNEVNQKYARSILEKQGCKVSIANNGEEALDFFKNGNFDIVLLDMQMPVMGGEEAMLAIRKCFNGNITPVIAFTAHAMSGDREKYIAMGMQGYVSKPVNKRELIRTMLQALK